MRGFAWSFLALQDYEQRRLCAFFTITRNNPWNTSFKCFHMTYIGVYMHHHHVQNTAVGALWWMLCTASWITCHMLEGLCKYLLLYYSCNIQNNAEKLYTHTQKKYSQMMHSQRPLFSSFYLFFWGSPQEKKITKSDMHVSQTCILDIHMTQVNLKRKMCVT